MKPCLGKPASPNKFDCSICSQASDRNTALALHAHFKQTKTTYIQYLPIESSSTTVASCKQVACGAVSCPQFFCICNLQGNPQSFWKCRAAFCLAATNGFSQVTLTSLGKHLPITNQIGKICFGWVFMIMKWAFSLDEINPSKSTSSQSRTLGKTLTEKAFASPCKHLWELSCPVKGYFCKLRLRVPVQMH